jgi:hypothetical protein
MSIQYDLGSYDRTVSPESQTSGCSHSTKKEIRPQDACHLVLKLALTGGSFKTVLDTSNFCCDGMFGSIRQQCRKSS